MALLLCGLCRPRPASGQSDSSLLRVREAAAALVRGNVDQAITIYTEALEDKSLPNDRRATILNDRGVAYSRRQQQKEAIEDFNRAIQLYPEYRRRLQQSRQRAPGPGRRQGGGQGFRPRAAAGARLCRRLQQPGRRLHEARPDRSGDRRLHQGHRADAHQCRGAERARPGASRGPPPARRHQGLHARGRPGRALQRRLPQPRRGQDGDRALR